MAFKRSRNAVTRRRIRTGNSFSKIDGFEELRDLLNSIADRSLDVYEEELGKAAQSVYNSARNNASGAMIKSKSGQLRNSIVLRKTSGSAKTYYRISAGGIHAPHAHLVEFGHRLFLEGQTAEIGLNIIRKLPEGLVGDVPAHPFLRKAFEENKPIIEAALNAALDNLLKGV
jgi:HK97 gp10 family phage protein